MKTRRYDPTGRVYMQGNGSRYPTSPDALETALRASYGLALTATWIVIAGLALSILMGV
jgi:hypothetical protein